MHACLCEVLQLLAALAALFLIVLIVLAHVTAERMPNLHRFEEEKHFIVNNGAKQPFPSIHDTPTKDLSVVVPSYNEETRLPVMLDEALEFLEKRQKARPSYSYEVIIVDDGSKDKTTKVALNYSKRYGSDKVRVLTLRKNRGKGGAVRMGVLVSRGKTILMADADGATKFQDLENVENEILRLKPWPDNMAISCGSRAHLEQESIAKLQSITPSPAVKHYDHGAFDVELLYIAQCLKIPVAEVAVNWTEIEGSKLVPFWSWLQMGRDLLFIRLRYVTGAWKLDTTGKLN